MINEMDMLTRQASFLVLILVGVQCNSGCSILGPERHVTTPSASESKPQIELAVHEVVDEALDQGSSAELWIAIGEQHERAGQLTEAIDLYERALSSGGYTGVLNRRLAVLYDQQHQPDKSRSNFEKAVALTPRDTDLLNDFGYFELRHGDAESADILFGKALAIDDSCNRAWVNRGIALAQLGRTDEAFQAFTHVVTPAESWANIGIVIAKQGDDDRATTFLNRAIAEDPDFEQPRQVLSRLGH